MFTIYAVVPTHIPHPPLGPPAILLYFVCVCPALELIRMKYFKILNIDKSELLIDQLSGVLTHMNVNMVINFIFDLWQERKSKLYC